MAGHFDCGHAEAEEGVTSGQQPDRDFADLGALMTAIDSTPLEVLVIPHLFGLLLTLPMLSLWAKGTFGRLPDGVEHRWHHDLSIHSAAAIRFRRLDLCLGKWPQVDQSRNRSPRPLLWRFGVRAQIRPVVDRRCDLSVRRAVGTDWRARGSRWSPTGSVVCIYLAPFATPA